MTALALVSPLTKFEDLAGDPLQSGFVYIGAANDNPRTNPVAVYWDVGGTQPVAQPLRTVNGFIVRGGTPSNVFVPSDYSLEVCDSSGRRIFYSPSAASINAMFALQSQLSGPNGANGIGFTAVGTGAVTMPTAKKLGELRGPLDFGGTRLQADDSTIPQQRAIDAALSDSTPGNSSFYPDGTWSTSGLTIDLTEETTSTAGRLSLFGVGNASCILMDANPNQNIFNISSAAGKSFGSDIHHLRFQVAPQGNNVNSYVLDTGLTSTMLDFQIHSLYINGMARGFGGQFVSGQFIGCIFDFMPDYGIHGKSKEFRKLEIVGDHFYKIAQNSIRVEGDTDSSGVATLLSDRDNGRGAGHYTVTGCGFDRDFSVTETCQNIWGTSVDNATHAGNWFNGKTPDQTTYPLDAIRYIDMRYGSFAAQQIWYYGRGVYLQDCIGLDISGMNVVKGNQLGQPTTGAITMINVSDSTIRANVIASGGLGVSMDTCTDCTVELRVTDSQYSGIYLTNCSRIKLKPVVVDANLADSATDNQTYGIWIGPGCSGIEIENPHSYVTNTAAGQKVNLFIDSSLSAGSVNIVGGGRLLSVRTGGSAVTDASNVLTISGKVRGYVTENTVQATINAGATTVTVAHGLARTPLATDFTIQAAGDIHGASDPWVSGVTSTNVTLTVATAPSGSSATWNVTGRTAR